MENNLREIQEPYPALLCVASLPESSQGRVLL